MSTTGATEQAEEADTLTDSLVDGLAARAAALDVPALGAAVEEVRKRTAAGTPPVGMQLLAESLHPRRVPPAPRQPIDDPVAATDCVRRSSGTVLEAADPAAVAGVLAGLVTDGLRLLVTGSDTGELAAIRSALPAEVLGLCLEGPEPLSAAELRELRGLLATSTPEREDRSYQLLPDPRWVPDVESVARLCAAAGRPGFPPRSAAELIPELLGELPLDRLDALVETARRCDVAVSVLNRDGQAPWAWDLLEHLLFGQSRPAFERLMALCAETIGLADGLRDAGDQLAVVGIIEPGNLELLRQYADFLDAGGRSRSYFRSPAQRAAEPALRQLLLENTPLTDSKILRRALAFIELIEAIQRIGASCGRLGLPVPSDIPAVTKLLRRLEIVAEAVRSVEVLRHEVLFVHPDSPVSMPDMETTEAVARAIITMGSATEVAEARAELAELVEDFEATLPARWAAGTADAQPESLFVPGPDQPESLFLPGADQPASLFVPGPDQPEPRPAPEHLAAVRALRESRLPDYLDAVNALARARREQLEQCRLADLLARLRAAAPGLAEAWQRTGGRTFAPGTVRFQAIGELLVELPDADTVDVVVLVGADVLDPGYLLVAAAAPRLVATSGGAPVPSGSAPPGSAPSGLAARLAAAGETVATMLRRSGVPVITTPGGPEADGSASSRGSTGSTAASGQVTNREPVA